MGVGHVPGATGDGDEELLAALADVVPGAFPDGQLDPTALLKALGVDDEDEHPSFSFSWPGIDRARDEARAATTATLVPDEEASRNWDDARDVLIEGDNLQVLKLLKSGYSDQVKLIYIDPPYNTGESFTYRDDFAIPESDYLEATGQVDEHGNATTSRIENQGRKHGPWLNMMMPRLALARHLLRKDGVIVVSIDDNEVHHLRLLMDAVFGAKNFVTQLVWKSKSGGANDSQFIAVDHEYALVYARDRQHLSVGLDPDANVTTSYPHEDEHGRYSLERLDKQSIRYTERMDFEIEGPDGTIYRPRHKDPERPNATWRWSQDSVRDRYDELVFRNGDVYTKNYEKDGALPRSLLVDERFGRTRTGSSEVRDLFGSTVFDNPKPTRLLQHLVAVFADGDDIVLDFFAGSASIGHAVWLQNARDGRNRACVMVQAPETPDASEQSGANALSLGYTTIFELAAARLRKAAEAIEANEHDSSPLGFRVFRSATTNLEIEPPLVAEEGMKGEDYVQASLERSDAAPVVEGADPAAVAWEVVLKSTGTQLNSEVELHDVDGVHVYEYRPRSETADTGRLFVCLEEFEIATADKLGLSDDDDTLILRGDQVDDGTTLTLAPRLQSRLVLLERVPREVSL